jgi:hypothetical protein
MRRSRKQIGRAQVIGTPWPEIAASLRFSQCSAGDMQCRRRRLAMTGLLR